MLFNSSIVFSWYNYNIIILQKSNLTALNINILGTVLHYNIRNSNIR